MKPRILIKQKYLIQKRLGGGDMSLTYAAKDQLTGEIVVVKELHPGFLDNWKIHELFEREAKALEQLAHPGIPQIIDHFEDPDSGAMYLMTRKIEGQTLEEKVGSGWRPSENEVKKIMISLLDILSYLHSFRPPFVHRDIKPSNIMIDAQGKIYLIDFGAVQGVIKPQGHSTVVGTFGFMAPEQFQGHPGPASDLYSAGVTAIFLLTGHPIQKMVDHKLKLNFRPHIQTSSHFANWLDKMTAPNLKQRFDSAEEALAALSPQETAVDFKEQGHENACMVRRRKDQLWVLMKPSSPFKVASSVLLGVGFLELVVVNSIYSAVLSSAKTWMSTLAMTIFMSPFYLSTFACLILGAYGLSLKKTLTLTPKKYTLQTQCFGILKWQNTGQTQEILDVYHHERFKDLYNFEWFSSVKIQTGYDKHFYLGLGNYTLDREWVGREVQTYLKHVKIE